MNRIQPLRVKDLRPEDGVMWAWQADQGSRGSIWFYRDGLLTSYPEPPHITERTYRVRRDQRGRLHLILGKDETFAPYGFDRHTDLWYWGLNIGGRMYERTIVDYEDPTDLYALANEPTTDEERAAQKEATK